MKWFSYQSLEDAAKRKTEIGGWKRKAEIPLWWNQVEIGKANIVEEEPHGFWVNFCKKGNMSKARASFFLNDFNPINKCDLCDSFGGTSKVRARHDVHWWDLFSRNKKELREFAETAYQRGGYHSKYVLCCGCWNKVRAIQRARREAQEIHDLKNQLLRGIKKWQKSKHLAS